MVKPNEQKQAPAPPVLPAVPLVVARTGLESAPLADLALLPGMANRHGLIAGATGTGKTVTLHTLAEQFSRIGVPVFLADVKGDLGGLSQPGDPDNKKVAERRAQLGLTEPFSACPVRLWDVFGEKGHPIRATISEMGPLILARLLDLNDTQTGVLNVVFKVADDQGLLLLDLKDLQQTLVAVGENAKSIKLEYGNVSPASIGAIQRSLLAFEQQGGDSLFGEPTVALDDLMALDPTTGHGVVNLLAADRLLQAPQVYGAFLLWLLSELFENLPEIGDPEKPRLVFFFDEAHLLFKDAPKALLDRIEQVVRLIRSKGVGVYFITQNPLDVPDTVLGQLGNRVQHALRAFTPRDQKAVRTAAETFRPNPALPSVADAITHLAVGEALVSLLDSKGMPTPVERALVCPPLSKIGPVSDPLRAQLLRSSSIFGKYEALIDRESAYEVLKGRALAAEKQAAEDEITEFEVDQANDRARREAELEKQWSRIEKDSARRTTARKKSSDSVLDAFAKSAARSIGTSLGRGILGGLLGKGTRKRR